MGVLTPQYKVTVLPKRSDGTGWNSPGDPDTYDITDFVDVSVTFGIEVKLDKFKLGLNNYSVIDVTNGLIETAYNIGVTGLSEPKPIKIDDRIRIWCWYIEDVGDDFQDPTPIDDYLLFDGVISEFSYEEDDNGQRRWFIRGNNSTEILLRAFQPAKYLKSNETNTAPLIIQDLLILANKDNQPEQRVEWDPTNPGSPGVPGNYTGTDAKNGFKPISFLKKYSPVYRLLADISKEKNLGVGNGDFYFYIETKKVGSEYKNYLVWRGRTTPSTFTDDEKLIEGSNLLSAKMTKGTWEMVNAVIIDCGKDPRGHAIHTFYYEPESFAKLGGKWKFITTDDGQKLISNEITFKSSSFGDKDNFPTSYPYTMYFDGTTVVNNDDEYNGAIRVEARRLAEQEGQKMVQNFGKPRYKLTCELPRGTRQFHAGQVVQAVVNTFGWYEEKNNVPAIRIYQVTHRLDSTGWTTDLTLEQDWENATTGEEGGTT